MKTVSCCDMWILVSLRIKCTCDLRLQIDLRITVIVIIVVIISVELLVVNNINDTQFCRREIVVNASVTHKDTNHISYKYLFLALFYDPLWKHDTRRDSANYWDATIFVPFYRQSLTAPFAN